MSLRIISGDFKGRPLDAPEGDEVRPTTGVVREALFAILGDAVEGSRVLDLFAGSGSVGFEALSRGALSATFIEREPEALACIRSNAQRLGVLDRVSILEGNAAGKIRQRIDQDEQFDLVYVDPPYGLQRPDKIFERLLSENLLAEGGFVVYEQRRGEVQIKSLESLVCSDVRRYGKTTISFYTRIIGDNTDPSQPDTDRKDIES